MSDMRPTAPAPRLPIIDALRGFAVAQMIVYHFIFDLNLFGWIRLRMLVDQPWTGWRAAIVTQFLLLVGVGLVLRTTFRPGRRDFWRRWAEVAGAALLVSAGSALLLGPRYIWFGILHFIAAALLVFGLTFSHPQFNGPPWTIIGLVTEKPQTEDYVPLLPWLGAVLIGAGLAALWQQRSWAVAPSLQPLNAHPPRLLVFLGTWALTIYLVHQPLMMGALAALRAIGL